MRNYAIILAGGEGHRAGGDVPKQFQEICGCPLVWWAARAFREADPGMEIVMVVHPGFIETFDHLRPGGEPTIPVTLCCGGRSRPESVINGLKMVGDMIGRDGDGVDDAVVLIHDGARPLVDSSLIRRGLSTLRPGAGAIPCVKSVSSLRELLDGVEGSRAVDRSRFVEVQTPQIFHYATIRGAYDAQCGDTSSFTDDASVAEACGVRIDIFEGDHSNIKVTHPEDFYIAEAILARRSGKE